MLADVGKLVCQNLPLLGATCSLYLADRQRRKTGSNLGAEAGGKGHGALATEGASFNFQLLSWSSLKQMSLCFVEERGRKLGDSGAEEERQSVTFILFILRNNIYFFLAPIPGSSRIAG